MPPALRGHALQGLLVNCTFMLLTGAQMAVELHLASVIPEKPDWVARRRWVPALYYLVGLG